jgi:CheY-like chemotaxis protein
MIILDYHLDGIDKNAMNGIETLDKIKEFNQDIPVVMLSSQDKIDVAISCMHQSF